MAYDKRATGIEQDDLFEIPEGQRAAENHSRLKERIRPSICLSVHLSVRPSVCPSVCPFIRLLVRLYIRPSRPPVCPAVLCLSSVRLSVRSSLQLCSRLAAIHPSICNTSIHPPLQALWKEQEALPKEQRSFGVYPFAFCILFLCVRAYMGICRQVLVESGQTPADIR